MLFLLFAHLCVLYDRIEFLVRDWQNFDADLDAAVSDDEKVGYLVKYCLIAVGGGVPRITQRNDGLPRFSDSTT